MKKVEEVNNKREYKNLYILGIVATVIYISFVIGIITLLKDEPVSTILICIATIIFITICFYLVKKEVNIGYYVCKNCNHKFVPSYKEAILAPHKFSSRYLKCPNCNKKTWARKVL